MRDSTVFVPQVNQDSECLPTSTLGEREWSHVNKLTNQKQFWFLLSDGKNASFLTCWGATSTKQSCPRKIW